MGKPVVSYILTPFDPVCRCPPLTAEQRSAGDTRTRENCDVRYIPFPQVPRGTA